MVIFPLHAASDSFEVIGGELAPGGIPVSLLAERVGATPFYVYDRAVLTRRVAKLRKQLPAALHLHYAIKANPMPAVVQHLSTLVDGLDVASAGEMMIALDTGTAPERISFAGPGKTAAEIRRAVAAGVVVTVESSSQLDHASRAGDSLGVKPRVALRVNPAFELKSSGMRMGGGAKPFGVDEELAPAMLERIRASGAQLEGLHVFAGSQNLQATAIVEAQRKTYELAARLLSESSVVARWINIGGGFGIPYFPGENELDLEPIATNLHDISQRARAELSVRVVIELGRYLVGPAGLYVSRVLDRKTSSGQVFLVTDGGLHQHLAASGNFGQVLRKNYPAAVANRIGAEPLEVQSVVGPLCTPLDLLADRMALPRALPGDLIAIFQSGAYGLTASPLRFLGHPVPAELLV